MKRILPALALLLCFGLMVSCGDDDDDGGGPGPNTGDTRVVAVASTQAPTMDPSDTIWNIATASTFDISTTNRLGGFVSALAPSVETKAIVSGGRLYVRLSWDDATHDVWRDCYVIDSVAQTLPYLTFTTPLNQNPMPEEDQALLVFNDPSGSLNPDVWNWRALTTDAGGVAEGMTVNSTGDSLLSDAQPNTLSVAISNKRGAFPQPNCVHPSTVNYDGHIISINDRICWDDSLYAGTDSATTWPQLAGWQVGDTIPGYLIDSLVTQTTTIRGSRWDIDAAHQHVAGTYHVILSRELNTGSADDLNLTTLPGDSVQIQIGLFDNQADPFEGTSRRGYTTEKWLILP